MHAPVDLEGVAGGGFARDGDLSHRFPPTMWDKLEVRRSLPPHLPALC